MTRSARKRSVPRRPRIVTPRTATNVPPPGWTPESDRREEFADLSALTVQRKTR